MTDLSDTPIVNIPNWTVPDEEDPVDHEGPWRVVSSGAALGIDSVVITDKLPPHQIEVEVLGDERRHGTVHYAPLDLEYVMGFGWKLEVHGTKVGAGDILMPRVSRETSEGGEQHMTWKLTIEGEYPTDHDDSQDQDALLAAQKAVDLFTDIEPSIGRIRSASFEGEAVSKNLIGTDATSPVVETEDVPRSTQEPAEEG